MYMDLKKWGDYRPQVPQDTDLFAGVEIPLSKAGLAADRSVLSGLRGHSRGL